MALRIDGKFLLGEMTPIGLDHSFFKGCWPGCHAVIKVCVRFCARKRAGTVAVAHGRIFHDVVLVGSDRFALLPERGAHCAVGVDGIAGPIAAGVGKVKSSRKCPGDDFEAELAGEQLGMALDAFEITGAAVKQEEAGFFTVGAYGNFFRVFGFVYDHPEIPIHSQNIDSEDVLGLPDRDIGFAQDFFSIFDALFPGNKLARLPASLFSFHDDLLFRISPAKSQRRQALFTAETLSSQSSECFLIKNSLLSVLRASASKIGADPSSGGSVVSYLSSSLSLDRSIKSNALRS